MALTGTLRLLAAGDVTETLTGRNPIPLSADAPKLVFVAELPDTLTIEIEPLLFAT